MSNIRSLSFALTFFALAACGGGGGPTNRAETRAYLRSLVPGEGVEVAAVEFAFVDAMVEGPTWGRVLIDPALLAEATGIEGGCVNVVTAGGWAAQNLPVPPGGEAAYAFYCDLGLDAPSDLLVTEVHLHILHTREPVTDVRARLEELGDLVPHRLQRWRWNAQGLGPTLRLFAGAPDQMAPLDTVAPVGGETFAHYQAVTNEQAAQNQCAPMALANALQFLENEGVLTAPHSHTSGLGGDKTLVGQLDTAVGRKATSRSKGDGSWFTPMVNGLFFYLYDNKQTGGLGFRHQGRGWGKTPHQALMAGDHSCWGSTSHDDGAAMTFDWIRARIQGGCAVVASFEYDKGGGHTVRITGCGRLNGRPWVRYSHDALQTDEDASDTLGLENVLVWLEDTDQDGRLNFGSGTRELALLNATCP